MPLPTLLPFNTLLGQVAALRTIGSQTHPAIQQMLLAHEQHIGELQLAFKQRGLLGGAPAGAAGAALPAELMERLRKLEAAQNDSSGVKVWDCGWV